MTFAEMVKNREWEKIFDILDQGTIEKKKLFPMVFGPCPDTWTQALPEQTYFC